MNINTRLRQAQTDKQTITLSAVEVPLYISVSFRIYFRICYMNKNKMLNQVQHDNKRLFIGTFC